MKKYLIPIVLGLVSFFLANACKEKTELEETRTVTVSASFSQEWTRGEIQQEEGSLNLIARWREDDKIALFLFQDGKGFTLDPAKVYNISSDGKRCSFGFQLPSDISIDHPYEIYGLCDVEGALWEEEGFVFAKSQLKRMAWGNRNVVPVWFHAEGGQSVIQANFLHLGTYEILHVTNSSKAGVTFRHDGFDVDEPWYKSSENTPLKEDYDPTHNVEEPGDDASSGSLFIPAGSTEKFLSWYVPRGGTIIDATLLATINGNSVRSSNTKNSSVRIQRGHVYHMYATWDGNELKFDKANELPDELGIGFTHLDMQEDGGYGFTTGREGHLRLESTDPSVATAIETDDIGEMHVDICAHAIGTAIITITDTDTGQKSQIEVVVRERTEFGIMVRWEETRSVTMKNADGHYEAYSEDESIATCEVVGNIVYVTGNGLGETTIHVTDKDTDKHFTISVLVYVDGPFVPKIETITVKGVSFKMLRVDAGSFMMGSPDDDPDAGGIYSDEKPQHQVTLGTYAIGETEVTQALWKAVMGYNPSRNTGDDLPVEEISWDEAQSFVKKLSSLTGRSFRLPTEAEWEFAARGGKYSKGYRFSGSDDVYEVSWNYENSNGVTHPVATKKSNELGLYDMSGNVWEWCLDWYDFSYYKNSPAENPCRLLASDYHIHRGGSIEYILTDLRVAMRGDYINPPSNSMRGLRLVLSDLYQDVNPQVTVPEFVDLGLSVKWASFNLGATKPEENGNYYAWGEIEPKLVYNENTYKWGIGFGMTKYCTSPYYGYNGYVDNKTVLEAEDDAAYVNLGDHWRMPSKEEIEELTTRCSGVWTTRNGVGGYQLTGPNGNSIFFPAAGYIIDSRKEQIGKVGTYQSSCLESDWNILCFHFSQNYSYLGDGGARYYGRTIRPVYDDSEAPNYILYDPTPEDGATGVDTHVYLSCYGHLYDKGENNFEVRVSEKPDMSVLIPRVVRYCGPRVYGVDFELESGKTYYWQVAEFDFDKEAWVIVSPIWHFTTK